MSTDDNSFISKGSEDKDRPSSLKPAASTTYLKPRLFRTPTPHTLDDHLSLIASSDSNEQLDDFQESISNRSFGSTCADPESGGMATVSGNTNVAQTVNGTRQKLSIFATIARLTAEDIEIARCTKANTKANSMIGKLDLFDPFLPLHQNSKQLKRKSFSQDLSKEGSSTSNPEYLADSQFESSEEDDTETLPHSLPPISQKKRRRINRSKPIADADKKHSSPDLSQDQRHQNLNPTTGPDCLSSKSTSVPEPKKKKTVCFDESNNKIFTYRRGSSISYSFSENEQSSSSNGGDDDFSDDNDEYDDEVEDDGRDNDWHSFLDPSGHLLSSSPWKFWSSLTTTGADAYATSLGSNPKSQVRDPILPGLLASPPMRPEVIPSSQESLSQEVFAQENLSQDNHKLFMDIGSSLDRLWSPSRPRLSPSPTRSVSPDLDSNEINTVSDVFPSRPSSPTAQNGSNLSSNASLRHSSRQEISDTKEAQCSSADEDVVMGEDHQLESLFKRVDQVRLISPPRFCSGIATGVSSHSRNNSIANTNPRRPILSPTPSKPSFKPPRLSRSTSFSASSTQKPPPLLRREASTTAILDAFL